MPFVVPTNYVRVGDKLFLHGSTASRLMRTLASGAPFCLSVTLLDGIVFSPTATGHSVNYRSVVVMGKAEVIESQEAKLAAMRDFVEYVLRGRWATVRPPSEQELKGTMVLAVPLVEASAKVRTGFAVDDDKEYDGSAWTGVLPFKWTPGEPLADPRGKPDIAVPTNIALHSAAVAHVIPLDTQACVDARFPPEPKPGPSKKTAFRAQIRSVRTQPERGC
jgi:nitroimidazol reductase NimA-like FMN-containing flavoprotein (pyridoxamine 5'-phosphate oxidase superfamily)